MELDRFEDERRHVETILTCIGDLNDPQFPKQFKKILSSLRSLICVDSNERRALRVSKVEPWNSVRVTFSLGPDAAERLRSLAAEAGGEVLARLGILSVQLRPSEQVISIRVAAPGNNPHGNPSGSVGGPSAVPLAHQAPTIHHSLHQQQQHQVSPLPQVNQLGSSGLSNASLHHQASTTVNQQLGASDGVSSRVLQHSQQGILTPPTTAIVKPPPPSPAPLTAQVQVSGPTSQTPSRSFPFPQQSPSHHLQLQQSKAPSSHYPPPPYPGGASSRPSVLSSGVNLEAKNESSEAVSPLLVNLLQNDGGTNVQLPQAQPSASLVSQVQQQPNVIPPSISPQPPPHLGSRSFSSSGAPQTVVHHRPPGQGLNPNSQAPPSHHLPLGSIPSRPHQPPTPSMVQVAQLQQQQQQQINAAHHQQQVSVVQPPTPTPLHRGAQPVLSLQSSQEENVRSPSPQPTQDLTSSGKARQYLINPLTGVLEPMSSESSEEEEVEAGEFPASPIDSKSDGEDSSALNGPIGLGNSVGTSTLQHSSVQSVPHPSPQLTSVNSSIVPSEHGSTTSLGTSSLSSVSQPEEVRAADKLKLRLKLDKSAPYNVCYTSSSSSSDRLSSPGIGDMRVGSSIGTDRSSSSVSEPRVPPLHISLRGLNVPPVNRCRERKREGKVRKKSEPVLSLPNRSELVPTLLSSTSPPPQPLLDRTVNLSGVLPLASTASTLTSPATVSCSTNTTLSSSSSSSVGTNNITMTGIGTTPLIDRTQPPLQVSAYPTEAEVASILRSVPEVTTDEKKRKRSHPKSLTPLRPQLEDKRRKVVNSTAAHSSPSSGSIVKTLIKHLAKDHPRLDKVDRERDRDRERQEREREREREREQQKKVTEDSSSESSPEGQSTPIVPFISNGRAKTTTSEYNCKTSPPSASAPPPSQASPQVTSAGYPAKPSPGDKAPGIDKAGEDSGIESMDALSEKSPNRGDSPNRKEETMKKEGTIIIGKVADGVEDVDEDSVEDPVPIRLTPALYTYSNPEKQREGSPPLEIGKSDYPASRSRSNSLSGGKSLLEQLLIDIPNDRERESASRRSSTSSTSTTVNTTTTITATSNGRNHRLANRSPEEPLPESGAPPSPAKPRGRKASESSTTSHDDAPTTRSKRKCSENATELIKACIGGVAGSIPTPDAVSPTTPIPSGNPIVPPGTPNSGVTEEKKRKEPQEEECEPEKRTVPPPDDLIRHRPKEDEKYKVGGRRSTRQEVKRTVHRKRQRPETSTVAVTATEPKLRRRTAAKETAK